MCRWSVFGALVAVLAWSSWGDDFNGRANHQIDRFGYYHILTTGPGAGGSANPGSLLPSGGAFRFITDDPDWELPIQQWLLKDWLPGSSALAMTLWLGDTPVYENSGIESADTGAFFQAAVDAQGIPALYTPGLTSFYSMSNNYDMIYAGYFRLDQPVTFDRITGYFAAVAGFAPNAPPMAYRMNIWRAVPGEDGNLYPAEAGFTGDVFSSDETRGDFRFSKTGLERSWTHLDEDARPIWRLTYILEEPIALEPGEYFFSHDAVIHRLAGPYFWGPSTGMPFLLAGGRPGVGAKWGPWAPLVSVGAPSRRVPGGGGRIVPEPLSVALVGGGAAFLLARAYRRRRRPAQPDPE